MPLPHQLLDISAELQLAGETEHGRVLAVADRLHL